MMTSESVICVSTSSLSSTSALTIAAVASSSGSRRSAFSSVAKPTKCSSRTWARPVASCCVARPPRPKVLERARVKDVRDARDGRSLASQVGDEGDDEASSSAAVEGAPSASVRSELPSRLSPSEASSAALHWMPFSERTITVDRGGSRRSKARSSE